EMNRLHLSHDYYTDISTFNLADRAPVAGELYISIDRVRENAKELHLPFQTELLRVIFHGVLHLCGYKDSTATQREEMRAAEDKYLNLYALV
ncbi:MAG TPA: rRNA maturation RNase YbeY, partial [Chitinophagaceae bacterium]|nr:rRNA maturation RNase YbeY [Chitinophagaceae bacterium]